MPFFFSHSLLEPWEICFACRSGILWWCHFLYIELYEEKTLINHLFFWGGGWGQRMVGRAWCSFLGWNVFCFTLYVILIYSGLIFLNSQHTIFLLTVWMLTYWERKWFWKTIKPSLYGVPSPKVDLCFLCTPSTHF